MKNYLVVFKSFVLLVTFVIGCSDPVKREALIIEKIFTPSSTSVGTGLSTSGNMVTMVNTTSAKYSLFIEEDGRIFKLSVEPETFFKLNKGDKIEYWNKWHGRYIIIPNRQ